MTWDEITLYSLAAFFVYRLVQWGRQEWKRYSPGPSLFTPGIYTRLRSM